MSYKFYFSGYIAGIIFLLLCDAYAHQPFPSYIKRDVEFALTRGNLDLALTFTFFNDAALSERREMDLNQDQIISDEEMDAYLKNMQARCLQSIQVLLDKQPLEMLELYSPEWDLFDDRRVAPSTFVIRLFWFTPLEETGKSNHELLFEDNAYPASPAVIEGRFRSNDGWERKEDSPLQIVSANSNNQPRVISLNVIHSHGNDKSQIKELISHRMNKDAPFGFRILSNRGMLFAGGSGVLVIAVIVYFCYKGFKRKE